MVTAPATFAKLAMSAQTADRTLAQRLAEALPHAGAAAERLRTLAWPLVLTRLGRVIFDSRGNVSRPKLLFVIALVDVAIVTLAGLAAGEIAGRLDGMASSSLLREGIIGVLVMTVFHKSWCYTVAALHSASGEMIKVASSFLIVIVTLAGVPYLMGHAVWTALHLVVWLVLALSALCLARLATASMVSSLTAQGLLRRRTVIVGGGKETSDLISALAKDGGAHLEILGVFDDRQGDRMSDVPAGLARLGTFEELATFCSHAGVDLAIVTVPSRAEERLLEILSKLFAFEVDIRISALSSKLRLNSSAYSYIGEIPMLAVMDKPLSDWDIVTKGVEDRVLGAALLLVVAPVMALVALAVRLDSKGPVLFKQRRYGFNNELIEVYKFRSMYTDMSDATAAKLVTKDDPRVTRVGRFIRRTSLDELPQLFNVLLGQMSLVGPRPHATQAKAGEDLYEDVVKGYFARHKVKPGVTGWAQINGWRGETDTTEKIQRRVDYDLYYIDNWSLLLDLYVIAVTPFALLSGKNAY